MIVNKGLYDSRKGLDEGLWLLGMDMIVIRV